MTTTAGYERRDAPAKWIAVGLVSFVMLIAIGALVAGGIVGSFVLRHPAPARSAFDRAAEQAAAPRLEVNGRLDRVSIERRAEAHLIGYGWADRQAGLAHIPIERAMALQAAQGWPDADTPPAAAQSSSSGQPPAGHP